jgi:hypothetical protein
MNFLNEIAEKYGEEHMVKYIQIAAEKIESGNPD